MGGMAVEVVPSDKEREFPETHIRGQNSPSDRCRCWNVRVTPTLASWPSHLERRFAALTVKKLQRSTHRPVTEREAAVMPFIDVRNKKLRPCNGVESGDQIRASVRRCRPKMSESSGGEKV